jgi:hypothetical protein
MVLLGICVVAILIGVLRLATMRTPLPTGSTYSAEPDGALGLYTWVQELGGSIERRHDSAPAGGAGPVPGRLLVVQPERLLDRATRAAYDEVPRAGGTLVVAGDSPAALAYARMLGLASEPVEPIATVARTPDGLEVPLQPRVALDIGDSTTAEPLLTDARGQVFAVRQPYRNGTLIVLSTPQPFLNLQLRDDDTARFVYREVVAPALGGVIAVDEAHHSFIPAVADASPATADDLLFQTPVGRAVLYAMLVGFAVLVLTGRRLGPAVAGRSAVQTRRTMYEHVQMLASLYRRGRQFSTVRAAYSRYYARAVTRAAGGPPGRVAHLSEAVAEIEQARTEPELIAAVGRASDAG